MQNEKTEPAGEGKQATPAPKDPFDLMLEHVAAAKKYGYSYMMMDSIETLIMSARDGTVGEFRGL